MTENERLICDTIADKMKQSLRGITLTEAMAKRLSKHLGFEIYKVTHHDEVTDVQQEAIGLTRSVLKKQW